MPAYELYCPCFTVGIALGRRRRVVSVPGRIRPSRFVVAALVLYAAFACAAHGAAAETMRAPAWVTIPERYAEGEFWYYTDLEDPEWNPESAIVPAHVLYRSDHFLQRSALQGNAFAMALLSQMYADRLYPEDYFNKYPGSAVLVDEDFWFRWGSLFVNPSWVYLQRARSLCVGKSSGTRMIEQATATGHPTSMAWGRMPEMRLAEYRPWLMHHAVRLGSREAQMWEYRRLLLDVQDKTPEQLARMEELGLRAARQGHAWAAQLLAICWLSETVMLDVPKDRQRGLLFTMIPPRVWLVDEHVVDRTDALRDKMKPTEEELAEAARGAEEWARDFDLRVTLLLDIERVRRGLMLRELHRELGPELVRAMQEWKGYSRTPAE